MDAWNIILGINVVIIGIAGLLFGWDKALYSIIFQYCSTQVLHALYKRYQKETLFIVTNHPKEVCEEIGRLTNHGATILEGRVPMSIVSGMSFILWCQGRKQKSD